jgi:hypothetical protein
MSNAGRELVRDERNASRELSAGKGPTLKLAKARGSTAGRRFDASDHEAGQRPAERDR